MMPQPATQSKPAVVRNINIHTGDYMVLSTDGVTWYHANVARNTCDCPAGQRNFAGCRRNPYCRHLAAAKYWAKCLAMSRKASRMHAATVAAFA